jgi:hypothetical protein
MFVEVIYETGAKSVAEYATEEEATQALEAQNTRAMTGEPGGPYQGPAERVKKAYMYDEHPATLHESGLLPVDEVKTAMNAKIDEIAMGGEVSTMELAEAVRNLSSPLAAEAGAFDSMYAMEPTGELTGSWA